MLKSQYGDLLYILCPGMGGGKVCYWGRDKKGRTTWG